MRVLIVNNTKIPAIKYGGTERVIWGLGKALHAMGHTVHYLVAEGSTCPFATVHVYNPNKKLAEQIPANIDVVHLNFQPNESLAIPYITTFHGNVNNVFTFDKNTVFISANQASRYNGSQFVYNGLDWDEYPKPELGNKRNYLHFLGDAAWSIKNVKGAIAIAQQASEKLYVLGGNRVSFNMGFKFFPQLNARFKGMVGGVEKAQYLQGSKGLVFPVLWHEPFGLAIIESMYYGCPVFGTPYGSLHELIPPEVGFTSTSIAALVEAVKNSNSYSKDRCHNYAATLFNARTMAEKYVAMYEKVLNKQTIHPTAPYLDVAGLQQERKLPMFA